MVAVAFEGRVAIVTGAGGGLGRAHALEIARRGGRVVVNDLGGDVEGNHPSPDLADGVVAEIQAAGGLAVANYDTVVTSQGAEAIVACAMENFGDVDILVNNAGNMRNGRIEDLSDEGWEAVIATHLSGGFRMTRAVWPHMKKRRYGRIVFTSSNTGTFGTQVGASYAAAKAGLIGLMNTAALEGKPDGILCNAILPTGLTRMFAYAANDFKDAIPDMTDMIGDKVGNALNPEFNTSLVAYLASEACKTTQCIFSQALGRYGRAFVGVVPGWQAHRQSAPTADEIAEHWDEIADLNKGFIVPGQAYQEALMVLGLDTPEVAADCVSVGVQ